MRPRHRFLPEILSEVLEPRVVLARVVGISPVHIAPLDLSARIRNLNSSAQ